MRKIRGVYKDGNEKIFLAACLGDPVWHIMQKLIPEATTPYEYWQIAWKGNQFPIALRDETEEPTWTVDAIKQGKRNDGPKLYANQRKRSR